MLRSAGLVVFAFGLAACAEGSDGLPPQGRSVMTGSPLDAYVVFDEDLPAGCGATPLEATGLPDSIESNPLVTRRRSSATEIAGLIGLDEAIAQSVDTALIALYQPDARLQLYALQLRTDWSSAESETRLQRLAARESGGETLTVWRSGQLVFVLVDQGAEPRCARAVSSLVGAPS